MKIKSFSDQTAKENILKFDLNKKIMLIYLMELTFLIPEGKGKYKIYFSNQLIFIKISSSIIIIIVKYFIIKYCKY